MERKGDVWFAARCLRPSAIMGQELIKSTVDASVFVINLTPALIRFVMTAALVPLSAGRRATTRGGWGGGGGRAGRARRGGAAHVTDSSSPSGHRLTFTIILPSNLWVMTQPWDS